MAHYINPAFCQKSEFSSQMTPSTSKDASNIKTSQNQFLQLTSRSNLTAQQSILVKASKQRREQSQKKFIYSDVIPDSAKYQRNEEMRMNTSGYALVPLEELCSRSKDRYAIIPSTDAYMLQNCSLRLTKSQDNLDLIPLEFVHEEKEEDSFTSLPNFSPQEDNRKLLSAFSSDFVNKSMILVDQNSMQRYTIVPTDDDEEVVDSNHEIIEMHNGHVHRYAVIPTDDDMDVSESVVEPCHIVKPVNRPNLINKTFGENNYIQTRVNNSLNVKLHHSTTNYNNEMKTPTKNPIATQKLHELLSTPLKSRKETFQRQGSYQTIVQKSPDQFQLQKFHEQSEFTPQKLEYDDKKMLSQNIDHRTTAIISPRLHQQVAYNTLRGFEKSWPNESFQKVENATATIGIISLMLILTGILNSGLCLYMVTDMRRSYYLDLGVISGFAAAALGVMGFRSRQCYWLPNRNYISGYVLATVFSLLNCCGLLVLLGLNPFPGTPFHDLTTGVILALSSLILLIISLGVITSKWCVAPPPDNRVIPSGLS